MSSTALRDVYFEKRKEGEKDASSRDVKKSFFFYQVKKKLSRAFYPKTAANVIHIPSEFDELRYV